MVRQPGDRTETWHRKRITWLIRWKNSSGFRRKSKDNPKVNGITIDRKMVMEETEKNIKTRIPYKKDEYIWLRKSEITWINGNKTIYAGLEKEKTYQVLDASNQPVRRVTGQQLYEQSYDPVNREQVKRQQEQQKKRERQQKKKEYQQAQKTLESAQKDSKGQGRQVIRYREVEKRRRCGCC